MRSITLGQTGITCVQNGFGALPIQRVDFNTADTILKAAFDGGMRFFDTARAYSDSEEKLGKSLTGTPSVRDQIFVATKTQARTPEALVSDLNTSLKLLKTDHVDILQLHCAPKCWAPGDGSGLYEALTDAKKSGKVLHIGITTHSLSVAKEALSSGLYETLQYPLSHISSSEEVALVDQAKNANVGFIAMKGLAGGLLNKSNVCFAFLTQFDNVMPIWGIQSMKELKEWLGYMDSPVTLTPVIQDLIEADRKELSGQFCRACGYCMPCTVGISIRDCARMSLMLRRAPTGAWLTPHWQAEMEKIKNCQHCGVCESRCPYHLNVPELLAQNLRDYQTYIK